MSTFWRDGLSRIALVRGNIDAMKRLHAIVGMVFALALAALLVAIHLGLLR
jgi:hypothetical protein